MRLNQGLQFWREKEKFICLLDEVKISIEGHVSFLLRLEELFTTLRTQRLDFEHILSSFPGITKKIIDELVERNILIDEHINPHADAVLFHGITKNPNNFYPHPSPERIRTLMKSRHDLLKKNVCSLDSDFQYLSERRSERNHKTSELELHEVEQVLCVGYGTTRVHNGIIHRTTPSAGGFYPLELFYLDFKNSGLYVFNGNELEFRNMADTTEMLLISPISNFTSLDSWSGVILCFARLTEICKKYGPKGYVFSVLEAGHVMQNIINFVEKKQMSSLEIGCLQDKSALSLVGLNKSDHIYLIGMLIGGKI